MTDFCSNILVCMLFSNLIQFGSHKMWWACFPSFFCNFSWFVFSFAKIAHKSNLASIVCSIVWQFSTVHCTALPSTTYYVAVFMPNGAWIVHILSREKLDPKSFHISSTFLCSENCLAFFSYGCQDQFARLHCSRSLAASSYSAIAQWFKGDMKVINVDLLCTGIIKL